MTRPINISLVMLLALPVSQAAAHHSTALFDLTREITLQGVVTQYDWANPHVYVQIETDAEEHVKWSIEAQPLAAMARDGWTSTSLTAGDRVTIVANPPKVDSRRIALGQTVLKDDGSALFIPQPNSKRPATSSDAPDPFVADSLAGRWMSRWDDDVAGGFLRARARWPLTEQGVAAMESYTPEMNPGKDCVPEPIPYRMIWPLPIELAIDDDVVTIRFETGEERRILMGVESHDDAPYGVFGHSIGTWDGTALLVDTAHFTEHRRGNAVGGLASSRDKHLVERFQLSPERTFMTYTFRLEDPTYLRQPVIGALELVYRPDFEFDSVPCDVDVARRYLQD